MQKIVKCNKADYPTLSAIWERSVRATHDFLNEDTVTEIKAALVPTYFPNVELYAMSHHGYLTGVIGLRIEFYFFIVNFVDKSFIFRTINKFR